MEFRNIPPVARNESPELLLTMTDLRRKREALNIGLQYIASQFGISYSCLSCYERGKYKTPQYIFDLYKEFLAGCENGTIYYKQRLSNIFRGKKKHQGRYPKELCVTHEQVNLLKKIRKSLKIKQQDVVIMPLKTFSNKETGRFSMLKTEYDALMKFYRTEKLKRIFGANYKEGMFKCH